MLAPQKLFRYLWIFYKWKIRNDCTLDYLPEEVSIEATNVCNFKCSFCPQSDPKHHDFIPRTYLDLGAAKTILANLRNSGIKTKTLHWTLDGEPFMNKRFAELCETALQYGFSNMYFATNGMLLTEDVIQQLPSHSGAKYTFTIDFAGDQTYFEEVRGTNNSWQRICANIDGILSDQRWQHIRIEIEDISTYKFADPADLQKRFESLQHLFKDPYRRLKIFHKTFHNATGLVDKPAAGKSNGRYHLCPYPWTSLFVASNGDVVACCRDLRRQTVLGNLLQQSLTEVWNGEAFITLRKNLVEGHPERSAVCDGCDLPFDDAKFSWRNQVRKALGRFQLFGE